MSVRGFFRAFWTKKGINPLVKAPDSLARAAKDAIHSSRAAGMVGTGATEGTYKLIGEGHEDYAKSFKKDKM